MIIRTRFKTFTALAVVFAIACTVLAFAPPETVDASALGYTLSGTCHVQDYGDTGGKWDASTGTLTLGTRGQSKRVEAITVNFTNNTGYTGSLRYRVHVQDYGWQAWKSAGQMAGTRGEAKRLEGIEIELTGELANHYAVLYSVHIQDYGDSQGWVSAGALAGTTGESRRLEEVKIKVVPIGSGSTSVNYRVHVQDYGWETKWVSDGALSGTTGEAKRLEGIEIHLTGTEYTGGITYRTHVQNIGWETEWSTSGEMSGTQGMSYRLEGIEIKLTGDIANHYDVYYRVHAQDYGWLGWAKNGEMSGTSGLSKRLEAIQIVLMTKDAASPGNLGGVKSATSAASVTSNTATASTVPSTTTATITATVTTTTAPVATTEPDYTVPERALRQMPTPAIVKRVSTTEIYVVWDESHNFNGYTAAQLREMVDITECVTVVRDGDGNVISTDFEETVQRLYERAHEFLLSIGCTVKGVNGAGVEADDLYVGWGTGGGTVTIYFEDGSISNGNMGSYVDENGTVIATYYLDQDGNDIYCH